MLCRVPFLTKMWFDFVERTSFVPEAFEQVSACVASFQVLANMVVCNVDVTHGSAKCVCILGDHPITTACNNLVASIFNSETVVAGVQLGTHLALCTA